MKFPPLPFLLILLFSGISINAQQIDWHKDYKEAAALAKETGKPILLDFTAAWCKPCHEMEETFWPRADIVELSRQFVCVKANFDKEGGLRDRYGINAIPRVIFTDPWGIYLLSTVGFGSRSGGDILKEIKFIPKDFSRLKDAGNLLENEKNNLGALNKFADFYEESHYYFQSNEFSKRVLKLENEPAKRELILRRLGLNYVRGNRPDEALDILEKFRKEFPESPNTDGIMFLQISAYIKKDKPKDAQKILTQLKTAYPSSPIIPNAEKLLSGSK